MEGVEQTLVYCVGGAGGEGQVGWGRWGGAGGEGQVGAGQVGRGSYVVGLHAGSWERLTV